MGRSTHDRREIISIHGLRVEPDKVGYEGRSAISISIHGLRVEPDASSNDFNGDYDISIHGLRVEPDGFFRPYCVTEGIFQSTGSVWSPTTHSPRFAL